MFYLLKHNLIRNHMGVTVSMQHPVYRAVIQRINVRMHLVEMNSDVEPFFARSRVKRIEDLFYFFVDITCSIQHATHNESVGDSLLVY